MKILILRSLVYTLQSSCSKNNKENCSLTMPAVAGTYRITEVKYNATATSPEEDYYNLLFHDICERDDLVVLNINYNYSLVDAGVKCSPSWDQTGRWAIAGNILRFDYTVSILPGPTTISGDIYDMESFDCQNLILSQKDVHNPGDKLTTVLTRLQ